MLIVEVKTKGGAAAVRGERVTLEEGALDVGRSSDNDVVLPDPTGAISRHHCRIEQQGDRYRLTDTSTNGVFLNAATDKVGRGNSVILTDGDEVSVGHYRLSIQVVGGSEARTTAGPTGGLTDIPDSDDDPFAVLSEEGALEAEDWLIDEPAAESGDDLTQAAKDFSDINQIGCEQDSLDPFQAVPDEQIPEDWDENLAPSAPAAPKLADLEPLAGTAGADPFADAPVTPLAAAAPATSAPPQGDAGPTSPARPGGPAAGPEGVRPSRAVTPPPQPDDLAALQAFLAGAGLSQADLGDADVAETMERLGKIYRDVVAGLRKLLEARRVIKGELRMSQTIIQQSGNNPLKWSLNDEKAMIELLEKEQPGCLTAQQAIDEAFEDLKAHQIAMVVGMERAIATLLKRFDPEALEERIDATSPIGKLMPGAKSRYWEQFTQLYAEIAREAEEDFDNLFGREFGKAYEEQVRQMTGKSGRAAPPRIGSSERRKA